MIHLPPPAERRHRGQGDSATFCVTSPERAAEVSVIPLPAAKRLVALVVAVDAFLDRFRDDPATRATYTETLRRLRETAGDRLPVAGLTSERYEQTMARWGERAADTWNKHLSALTSFMAYCHRQDWLTTDPGRRSERR